MSLPDSWSHGIGWGAPLPRVDGVARGVRMWIAARRLRSCRNDILGGMNELRVPSGPGIPDGVVIPGQDLTEQFSRASGPGGQGVNTTDSRVQLSLDLAATHALTDAQRERAMTRLAGRLTGSILTVDAAEHRSQHRNRTAARERMAALLRGALAPPPPPRRATRRTRGSQRRRLETKRQRSETKRQRERPRPE